MHLSLNDALKYATKVRASAADYHKAFDRLAADPKAEEGANEKALVPTEFFADHLRSEGQHPQADLIAQAMTHSKEQGEPVVYSEQIAQFPPHHRDILEGLGQGDFHLVLGKPNSHHTAAVLYQRSHTDPSKVFGWTDSIEGTPDEVKAEVERFQRAGVPVELAIGPQHKDYAKWAKHFGLSGYSEESEQYAAVKYALDSERFTTALSKQPESQVTALALADFLQENDKEHHAAVIRNHVQRTGTGATLLPAGHFLSHPDAPVGQFAHYTESLGGVGELLHLHHKLPDGRSLAWEAHSPEGQGDSLLSGVEGEGSQRLTHPLDLMDVPTDFGPEPQAYGDWLQENHSTLERALKYVQETHADFHNRMWDNRGEGDSVTPLVYADWLQGEQGKEGHAQVIRKHVEEQGGGPNFLTKGRLHFWPLTGIERLFDTDDHPTTFHYSPTEGLTLQQHSAHQPDRTVVWKAKPSEEAEALAKKLQEEGSVPVDMPAGWEPHKDPVLKSVNPTYGEIADPVSEQFSASDKPLRYSAVPEHEIHEDYAPNGVAPRIGHTLKQLAQEDTTTGALAEGILRTGDHSILPILADRLEETEHPLASVFDWRHAPRAIRIDRAMRHALSTSAVNDAAGTMSLWRRGARGGLGKLKAALMVRLSVPDASQTDLWHSLVRLNSGAAPTNWQDVVHKEILEDKGVAGDPHRYEDTRKQNKRVYSAERVRYSHEAFQKQLVAHPEDHTTVAVYGDFVEDTNGPTHAEVVRRAAEGSRKGGGWHNGGHFWIAGNSLWGDKGDFAVAVNAPFGSTDTGWSLDLTSRHLHEAPSGDIRKPIFTLHDLSREEVKRLVKGLHAEGASMEGVETAYGARDLWKEIQDEQKPPTPEPTYEDTKKYGSWRAPAGGMVVQQSPLAVSGQWAEGGEFVNDLQKMAPQPVDYKQKPKKRLTVEYLRQHFRKRRKAKGVTGVRVIDDTAGEGDAGAEAE